MVRPNLAERLANVDGPNGSIAYSYIYITALWLSLVVGVMASVAFGFVTPDITVTADISIGYLIEYMAVALVVLFLFWSGSQVTNIVGVNFVSGVITVFATVADNYRRPRRIQDTDDAAADDTDTDDVGGGPT